MLAAANPTRSLSGAHDFNIARATRSHAASGYGPHFCIGQHLGPGKANAMNPLLDRLPELRAGYRYPPPKSADSAFAAPSNSMSGSSEAKNDEHEDGPIPM